MHLKDLSLVNFKNLNQKFKFVDGINIISAANGSGKTNILEAIYILGNSSSFHSYPEVNLINFERTDFAKISGLVGEHTYEIVVSSDQDSTKKKLLKDGTNLSASKFSDHFDVLIFSPTSVDLVSGSPSVRRNELDNLLSSLDKQYKKNLSTYQNVVRNRNKILYKLKYSKGKRQELKFWDEKLVDLGTKILIKRLKALKDINNLIETISEDIFHTKNNLLKIKYEPSFSLEEDMHSNFQFSIRENIDQEISTGYTLFGPHKDDLRFDLSGQNARVSSSRGQQRICSLLFTLSSWNLIYEIKNQKPILLLDDIMSELDVKHQKNVLNTINSERFGQVIISTSENMKSLDRKDLRVRNVISF